MEHILNNIGTYLLAQSWQIGVIFVVVAAASLAMRRASAHWRYLLWVVVLVKCFVPPLVSVPLAVLPESVAPPVIEIAAPVAPEQVAPAQVAVSQPPEIAPVASKSMVGLSAVPAAAAGPNKFSWLGSLPAMYWLTAAWAGGLGLFGLYVLAKAYRIGRQLNLLRDEPSEQLQAEVTDLAGRMGLARVPRVWLVKGWGQPFVWGLLRGEVYLPQHFARPDETGKRRQIIAHELAHIARFDAAVNALQVIAQGLFFFHPLVWWANKRIRAEREKCCDEMAIAHLSSSPRHYGSAIVDALVRQNDTKLATPSLAIAGPVKNVEDRIKTILTHGRKFYRRPTLAAVVTVLILAGLCVPTALVLTTRPAEAAAKKLVVTEDVSAGIAVISTTIEDSIPALGARFIATLANGDTVELVGVANLHGKTKTWWRPDGSELIQPPYRGAENAPAKYLNEIVIRYSGPSDAGYKWKTPNSHTSGIGKPKDESGKQIDDLRVQLAKFVDSPSVVTFRFGVATGQWRTLASQTLSGGMIYPEKRQLGQIIISSPEIENEKVVIQVATKVLEPNTRFVAIKSSGEVVTPWIRRSSSYGQLATHTYKFGLPLEEIDHFEFQTRPYEWVEFKNVSLKPGFKTNVQIISDAMQVIPRVTSVDGNTVTQDVSDGIAVITVTSALPIDDNVVTEGVGFGKVVIGATIEEVIAALGKPEKREDKPHTSLVYRKSRGVDIIFPAGRAGEIRFNPGFGHPLKGGPGIGTPLKKVLDVYGQPKKTVEVKTLKAQRDQKLFEDRVLYELPKAWKIIYGKEGVLFWFDKNKRVSQFVVFKPRVDKEPGSKDQSALRAKLINWVEKFFSENYRDITARKTLGWGQPVVEPNGNISITYKYLATIWDKDKLIIEDRFTFTPEGKYVSVKKLSKTPAGKVAEVPAEKVDVKDKKALKAHLQKWVEKFFSRNYRDITARETLEWGEPKVEANGNVSIRYKFEATIRDKDKLIIEKRFTFTPEGKYVSAETIETAPAKRPAAKANSKSGKTFTTADLPDVDRREVSKELSEFPAEVDLSTPEGAWAAWQRSHGMEDSRLIEVLAYPADPKRQNVAMAFYEVKPTGAKPYYSNRYFGRILGKWQNISEPAINDIDKARMMFFRSMSMLQSSLVDTGKNYLWANPQLARQMAQDLFDTIRKVDYAYYNEAAKKGWPNDELKRFPGTGTEFNYTTASGWLSLAEWICREFSVNPITDVELGEVFKEKGTYRPAVPYKVTLKDGKVLSGYLPFVYRARSGYFDGVEGIDWHHQYPNGLSDLKASAPAAPMVFASPLSEAAASPVPAVVKTFPAAFTNDVNPRLNRITVTFNKRMTDGNWAWVGGGDTYPETTGKPKYNSIKTTCILPVKLKPGTVYYVGINSPKFKAFKSVDGTSAKPYVILFATKSADGKPTLLTKELVEKAVQVNSYQPAYDPAKVPTEFVPVPNVANTFPPAFATDVDPKLSTISVTFNEKMRDGSWAWVGGGDHYPETTGKPKYDSAKTTCTLPVKLQPGKIYRIGINSVNHKSFRSTDGRSAQPYVILFSTRAADGTETPLPKYMAEEARRANTPAAPASVQVSKAKKFVDLFAAKKFTEAQSMFGPVMGRAMSAKQLEQLYVDLEDVGGEFQGRDEVYHTEEIDQPGQGKFKIVYVPCRWERNRLELKVVFNEAGQISGLWTVPPAR